MTPKIWSLWDIMKPFKPSRFYIIGLMLGDCRAPIIGNGQVSDNDHSLLDMVAQFGTTVSTEFGMKRFCKLAEHVRDTLAESKKEATPLDAQQYEFMREECERHFEWDSQEQLFMHLSEEEAKHYDNSAVLSESARQRFPRAYSELLHSGNCLAAGCPTASVFHSMRAAERALHAHAEMLGVTFPFSLELADWQNVIEGIEKKIKEMKTLPKTDAKAAEVSFHSKAASQYWFLKDAWRNHVAHAREEYTFNQARSILAAISDLIETLSTRVEEPNAEVSVPTI